MQNKFLLAGVAVLIGFSWFFPHVVVASDRSVQELYALAKAKDPVLGRAAAQLEAGKADQEIAWAALLPRVNANAGIRRMWHTVVNYGPKNVEGSYDGHSYGMGGQLALFNLPSYLQVAAANSGARGAEASVEAARQDLIVRLVNDYVRLLKAQADEQLYRDELSRVGTILEQAKAFLQAGTGDIIAVYEAKARLDSAAADLIKTEAQRRLAEQSLSSLTGVPVVKIRQLAISEPKSPLPAGLDWWLDTMQKNNPAVRQAKEELAQAKYYSNANRAGHLPTVQLQGGYTVEKGSTFLPEVETRQWYVGASITVPIFSGGETSARTRRALAGESERRFALEDVQEQNTKKLKEVFLNLQYSVSLAEAYKRKYESADAQLQATRKGREIGTRTAIDLLNAEQSWAVSRRDLASALYDNLVRYFELRAAAGVLQEGDLQELGELSLNKPSTTSPVGS